MIKITEINTYPVKSLKGYQSHTGILDDKGLQYDRNWMLVDSDGLFISQREQPKMATIHVNIKNGQIGFSASETEELVLHIDQKEQKKISVQVWDDVCEANEVSITANDWFSTYLGKACRLVKINADFRRIVDPTYTPFEAITGFSDAYPFLLISEASLEDLNTRLDTPVPMNRFRPNLVISGTEAYAEDSWQRIRIGDVLFEVAKPCKRCVMTTIDQVSGQKGKEPLLTLSKYRKVNNKVLFGQNLVHHQKGEIQVGMEVEIISVK